MSEDSEWTEVKPRRQTSKIKSPEDEPSGGEGAAPTTPRARTQSFGESEFKRRGPMGRVARREKKLEWSASKARERDQRIEKRDHQREAAAREREEANNKQKSHQVSK